MIARVADGQGVLSFDPDNYAAEVQSMRDRFGDLPTLLAGMVGSRRGWREAPYVPCPAGIESVAAAVLQLDERTMLVPGVSYEDEARADVMRGEEMQLFGAIAGRQSPSKTICLPGTHNKWAHIANRQIRSFRTMMTGDLYAALGQHSALSELMQAEAVIGDAFRRGVRHALAYDDLISELFAARGRVMVGRDDATGVASFVSGLLIGTDVKLGLESALPGAITVVASPSLAAFYSAALELAGRQAVEVEGERAFLDGVAQLIKVWAV
jgi:2-dehydro-3-deoxygalactonokinase